jgi:hypothetical protein
MFPGRTRVGPMQYDATAGWIGAWSAAAHRHANVLPVWPLFTVQLVLSARLVGTETTPQDEVTL